MKRFRLFFMSVMVLLLGCTLVACSTKSPNADFTVSEEFLSVGQEISLDDYLRTSTNKNKIVVKSENTEIVSVTGKTVKAESKGATYLYAIYNSNVLAKIHIIVKDTFSAPTGFNVNENGELVSETGELTWSVVSDFYQGDSTPTVATQYKVEGTVRLVSSRDGEPTGEQEISSTVSTNKFTPTEYGIYTLTVKALGTGHFDSSPASDEVTFYYGAMPKVLEEEMTWNNNGTLTWEAVDNAKYKISINGIVVGNLLNTNTADLSEYFENAIPGEHRVSVIVYDASEEKLPTIGEVLMVTKLDDILPNYNFSAEEGGVITVPTNENVDKISYKIMKDGNVVETREVESGEGNCVDLDLDGVETGYFSVVVCAIPVAEGNFFRSNEAGSKTLYKLAPIVLSNQAENTDDANSWTVNARTAITVYQTKINAKLSGNRSQLAGFNVGENTKTLQLNLENSGTYTLSIVQIPNAESYETAGDTIFAINSDESNVAQVTKLAAIGNVSHSYSNNKSVFSFAKVENATRYELYILDGEDYRRVAVTNYEMTIGDENVTVEFTGEIEEQFASYMDENVVTFKIVAKMNDDSTTINASREKTLTELSAPEFENRQTTDMFVEWTEIENAGSYRVLVYELDKATYDLGVENIDTSSLTPSTQVLQTNRYNFAEEGYYLVEVYALSGNENDYISATTALRGLVCVAEQLTLGNVDFGHNGTNYFVEITNTENVDKFAITVDGARVVNDAVSGQKSRFTLTQTFEDTTKTYEISVVGLSNDPALYIDTNAFSLNVKKLPIITLSNVTIDEWSIVSNASYNVTSVHQYLNVEAIQNAKGVKVWETADTTNKDGGPTSTSARFDLAGYTNVQLSFKYYGSTFASQIYTAENGYVYLDSEDNSFTLQRANTPSDLEYYDGVLSFVNTSTTLTEGYDLTIFCKDSNDIISNIVVTFGTKVTAKCEGHTKDIASTNTFVTASGNNVSIELSEVLELLKEIDDDTINYRFNSAVDYGFSVYLISNDKQNGILNSKYSTLKLDANKNVLNVQKMAQPELEYEINAANTNIIFSWTAVSTRTEVASSTTYQMYLNGEEYGAPISGLTTVSYTLSEFDLATYYSFYLVAENPYYTDSSNSNTVRVFKLSALDKMKLISGGTYDGQLEYQIASTEQDFVDSVLVNGTSYNVGDKISNLSNGNITVQAVGKKNLTNGNVVTSYIDSQASTWTLANMSTLAPASTTVSYANNIISWDAFAEGVGLTTLKYVLMFNDGTNVATYTTTETSLNINTNTALYTVISSLDETDITITVYAYLETYRVVAGGTIYYAPTQVLENESTEANYYRYTPLSTLKKLTTPEITSVAFDYQNNLANAGNPDIVVKFVGNYDQTASFRFLLNDDVLETVSLTKADGVYTYTIHSAAYNNEIAFGANADIKIYALSATDIPSSMGSVQITRTAKVSEVAFETVDRKFTQNLVVTLNSTYASLTSGGLVAKVTFTPNGGTAQVDYLSIPVANIANSVTYDMSTFISTNLAEGGKIKVDVLTNSYANDASKIYYLSCSEYKESAECNVLASVKAADITTTSAGFEIDKDLNSTSTNYVVEYLSSVYQVNYNSETEKFAFEFDSSWENGNYDLTIYATERNYIRSASKTLSFVLDRIDPVTSVTLTRDANDLSQVTLSWTQVANASGYVVKVYSDSTLIYRTEVLTNSATTLDLFGKNFSKIVSYGEISSVPTDLDVRMSISAIGQTAAENNSTEYVFNATLKGNRISVEDIEIDEYGMILVDLEPGTYLYRFVGTSASSPWTEIVSESGQVKINAGYMGQTLAEGTKFNIEIIVKGTDSGVSTNTDFAIDSATFTTEGKEFTLQMGTEIDSVGIDMRVTNGLAIVLTKNAFDKIYFGVSEDAIYDEEVREIEAHWVSDNGATAMYNLYASDLLDILSTDFRGVPYGQVTLYFWAYREIESAESSFVTNGVASFAFTYEEDCGFDEVKKYEATVGGEFKSDYASTFVFFNKPAGLTLFTGIFAKIVDENEDSWIAYISDLTSDYYPDANSYIINLTEFFNEHEDLKELDGHFTIDFATVKIGLTGLTISNWLSNSESVVEFVKLKNPDRLTLSSGILKWQNRSEDTEKYYVYFIEDVNDGDMGDTFARYDAETESFIATDFIGQEQAFYIAIQAISTEPNVMASNLVYVKQNGDPVKVTKNMIKSKLKLENGKLFFDWENGGDFVSALAAVTGGISATDARALVNKTYSYPFTFKLADLVNNRITMRFRFAKDEGGATVVKNVDVNAKDLLINLFDVDPSYEEKITTLLGVVGDRQFIEILSSFRELMKTSGSHGVANVNTLFDDYFEAIQAGEYSLEYFLVGGSTTLNSYMYEFENTNGDNIIYVGSEPAVKAYRETTASAAVNHYKLLVRKSTIYDTSYTSQTAENYVIKIYNDVGTAFKFAITKLVNQYSLSMLDSENASTVTVVETDENGDPTPNGEYLMFYLNHNSNNSLLGRFGEDIDKGSYSMEIYAVGNDVNASSKSEYFRLTFYGMGESFAIENGMFTWTTQSNRNTTVVYKRNDSLEENTEVLDGSLGALTFSLENAGSGVYDYIEFITIGDISSNSIAVDSEIYIVENAYKLYSPTLLNTKGFLSIDDRANREQLLDGFSMSPLFTYRVYNNESTETSYNTITDLREGASAVLYETGATGVDDLDDIKAYKETENDATNFFVSSIGSTARFGFFQEGADYYIKKVYGLDEEGQKSTKHIIISSEYSQINARMIDAPEDIRIENGLLAWEEVEGRDELELNNMTTVVYRVAVDQYKVSNTSVGQTETLVANTQYFYTTKLTFDFSEINEATQSQEADYLKVVVKAMAMIVSDILPEGREGYQLVEGGYAYGNVQYKESNTYVLMGEGAELKEIERSEKINSLAVETGKLVWKFDVDGTFDLDYNLLSDYFFTVVGEAGEDIEGELSVAEDTENIYDDDHNIVGTRFKITFTENAGQIAEGTQTLTVYAIKNDPTKNIIRSYGTSKEVTKLKAVDKEFVSVTSTDNPEIEKFDLSAYFEYYPDLVLTINTNLEAGALLDQTFFTRNKYILYILSNINEEVPEDANSIGAVVIGSDRLQLSLQGIVSNAPDYLFADVSDDIVLQRAEWNGTIEWNSDLQQFEWEYDGEYSLQNAVSATKLIYDGSDYEEIGQETISAGTLYLVVDTIGTNTIISVDNDGITSLYRLESTNVIGPTFIVEITYGDEGVTSTYTTSHNYFVPTIIDGHISIGVRIKLGPTNIQSAQVVYEEAGQTTVSFDLFDNAGARTDGTTTNPYQISTAEQFENLSKRMEKNVDWQEYIENGTRKSEEDVYHFVLTSDITLEDFQGVMFGDTFGGVIDGLKTVSTNYKITYKATDVGEISGLNTNLAGFTRAISIFKELSSSAIVKNIDLDVTYDRTASTPISQNTLLAGLAITNAGQIENVNLVGFSSNLTANFSGGVVDIYYAGIASLNIGQDTKIKNCSNKADMIISTAGYSPRISIAGIVSKNYAKVENCVCGENGQNKTFRVEGEGGTVEIKMSGVAIVNASGSEITNCTNYTLMTASAIDGEDWVLSVAGMAIENNGRTQTNSNPGYVALTPLSTGVGEIHQAVIYIGE